MLKKWKKTIKLLATTIIVLLYVTIGVLNTGTLKEEEDEEKKKPLTFALEPAGKKERYFGTVKTIIGYSEEFRIRQELSERIDCVAKTYPDEEMHKQESMWRYEEKLGIKIFTAYYDQRQEQYHYVRVIGLVRRNSSFYCQIWYENNETITYITQKAIVQEIWSTKWGIKNKTCESEYPVIINCLASLQNKTTIPSWVSFVDKSCSGGGTFVKITKPTTTFHQEKKNFVICVKPLNLNHFNKKNILEWLEINLRLGAEKIIFYVFNSTTKLESGFQDYTKKQTLEWKEFKTPQRRPCALRNSENSIWHKRKMEIIAYNDCFYSNLYHTKFVIPLDVDEIIVPKTKNTWFEAFRSYFLNGKLLEERKNEWPENIENYASFSVRNAYFFSEYPKDAIIKSLMLPKRDQNVPIKLVKASSKKRESLLENIFDRTLRSYRLSPQSDSVKSFIYVPKTLSVFNHYAFHVLGEATRQFIFPENVFQLNHYRNSCDPLLIDGCREFLNQVIYDYSLEKFRKRAKLFF